MTIRLLTGDCRDVLATLPAESVQCVVTSPPYFGLRDYQTASWDGGDAACDHRESDKRSSRRLGVFHGGDDEFQTHPFRDACGKCGAVRVDRQIGLEATPDEYLATMVGVFREVRRVLRRDGTCWVNMGDSYAGPNNGYSGDDRPSNAEGGKFRSNQGARVNGQFSRAGKPKDLLLMPARLALALQADGWFIRSQMPWVKRSCMPESATDRPTSAIEYIYMLTKNPRYFWDAEAVKKRANPVYASRYERPFFAGEKETRGQGRPDKASNTKGALEFTGHRNFRNSDLFFSSLTEPYGLIMDAEGLPIALDVTHEPFKGAHFACFPSSLVAPLILGATSERGCCAACGKPWGRVTDTAYHQNRTGKTGRVDVTGSNGWDDRTYPNLSKISTTTGWSAGCDHGAEVVPCTVLDPFAGAGTTLLVADRLQRDAIGIELNTAYTEMAMERCRQDAPLFTAFPPAEPPEDERMADLFAGDEYERPAPAPKPLQVPRGWDTGPGAHGTIHRTGRTMPDMAAD